VLYEALTGAPPFDGESVGELAVAHLTLAPRPPSSVRATVPADLDAVVLRCLEKDPVRRFQSMGALAGALEEALGEMGLAAAATSSSRWAVRSQNASRSAPPGPADRKLVDVRSIPSEPVRPLEAAPLDRDERGEVVAEEDDEPVGLPEDGLGELLGPPGASPRRGSGPWSAGSPAPPGASPRRGSGPWSAGPARPPGTSLRGHPRTRSLASRRSRRGAPPAACRVRCRPVPPAPCRACRPPVPPAPCRACRPPVPPAAGRTRHCRIPPAACRTRRRPVPRAACRARFRPVPRAACRARFRPVPRAACRARRSRIPPAACRAHRRRLPRCRRCPR
jgi:hypothetical protein